MNVPTDNASPDPVLSSDNCLCHRGPLAHPGQLVLTQERLCFYPSRTLDRIAGADDVAIPIDTITELAAGGIQHSLDITTSNGIHRFSGRGALRVHGRLISLLAENQDIEEDEERPLFDPGERVLLQGQAELFINDLMAVRGELTLTDLRFRFQPGVGLERLFWNTSQFDAPLNDVSEWRIQGIRRRLSVKVGDKSILLGGSLAPPLVTQFDALLGTGEPSSDASEDALLETWPVSLRRGPVAHEGNLTISPSHIGYMPSGLLDAMIGVKQLSFPIEAITRLCLRGWPERKMVFQVGHETHTFSMPDTMERFESLQHLVRDRHQRISRQYTSTGRVVEQSPPYQQCLDRWSTRIGRDPSEQILVSCLAADFRGQNELCFGWLLLTANRMLFLPLGGPATRQPVHDLPVEGICRLDGGPRAEEDQIILSSDERTIRFLLAQREGMVEEFWSKCRSPSRILTWDTLGPRSLARVSGDCRFVRIMVHGDMVVDMSPGLTTTHEDGVAIVLPGEPGSSIPNETWVTVEIGQTEGIYQFDSKITRSTLTPLEGGVPDPESTHLLIASFPTVIRFYNQRESYRVPTHMKVKGISLAQTADGASWMATGDALDCTVIDLSIGGVAVTCNSQLQLDDRLAVTLPLLDQWVEFRVECVRIGSLDEDPDTPVYGLRFFDLTIAQEDILHKAVMILQREALVDDAEEDDTGDEVTD